MFRKRSENHFKKVKNREKSTIDFFFREFFLEVSAAELINAIEHNYESEKANKTSGKKLFREQNKANKVSTESLCFKLFFAY